MYDKGDEKNGIFRNPLKAREYYKIAGKRYRYKTEIEDPTEEARSYIWRSMIPDLCDNDIHVLAEKYDFSGGQIENIARHYAIDTILHGTVDNKLKSLILHCDNEKISGKEQRRIGF